MSCRFWFSEFLSYVQEYDQILRIDDDCFLIGEVGWPTVNEFQPIASVHFDGLDRGDVILGLQSFFNSLAASHNEHPLSEDWDSPYTNVMMFNLNVIRKDPRFLVVFNEIRESRCIWINRWGDMPLWGATLQLLHFPTLKMDGFNYYHASHRRRYPGGIRVRMFDEDGWAQAHPKELSPTLRLL
jgi:hypothetical protein